MQRHFVRKECVRFNQLIFARAFACIRSSFPLQVEARKEGCHVGILSKTDKRAAEDNSAATKNITGSCFRRDLLDVYLHLQSLDVRYIVNMLVLRCELHDEMFVVG